MIRTREELLETFKTVVGEDEANDNVLTLLEDLTDTINDLESKATGTINVKETEEYNKVVNVFDSAKTHEELNNMLLDIFDSMGFNKPWQGDFDEHMSNKNGTLRFE